MLGMAFLAFHVSQVGMKAPTLFEQEGDSPVALQAVLLDALLLEAVTVRAIAIAFQGGVGRGERAGRDLGERRGNEGAAQNQRKHMEWRRSTQTSELTKGMSLFTIATPTLDKKLEGGSPPMRTMTSSAGSSRNSPSTSISTRSD